MSFFLKTFLILSLSLSFAWAQDPAVKADALKLWEKRDDKASLSEAIKKFEQLHKATPADTEILLYLTRCHFLMGDAHTNDKDQKLKQFETAFGYGDKALNTVEEYVRRVRKNEDIKYSVKALGINEVPQMYWTAASVGKFAKANGIFSSLKYKGKILALISRVEELKPDFFYGSVDRYWGSYYAVIPGFAGKDLAKSQKYFAKALVKGPEYLGTKVLEAETYYVEKEDQKGFTAALNEVLANKQYDNHPELGPENRMEKIKAQKLLDKAKDLF